MISVLAETASDDGQVLKRFFSKIYCVEPVLHCSSVSTRVMTSTRKNHESYEKLAASFSPQISRSNENHSVQCITTSIQQVLNSRSVKLSILTGRKWFP